MGRNIVLIMLTLGVILTVGCNQQQNTTNLISPPQIDTSNWKTYADNGLGWEMSFPRTYVCGDWQVDPCSDQRDKVEVAGLDICSEDTTRENLTRGGSRPTVCFHIDRLLRKKPGGQDFYNFIKEQSPKEEEREKKDGIELLRINDPLMLNGHKMVKLETVQSFANNKRYTDHYLVEKNDTTYIRIDVFKNKLEEVKKRSQEIDAIISSIRVIK